MARKGSCDDAEMKRVLLLSLGLLLSSCGSVTPPALGQPGTPVLSPDPAYTASVSQQDPSLLGTDRDQDGTRDDLDLYFKSLSAQGVPAADLAQAERYVRATAKLMQGDASGQATSERLAASLALQLSGRAALTGELEALMLNTELRASSLTDAQAVGGSALVQVPRPLGAAKLSAMAPVIVFQNGIFTDEAAAAGNLKSLQDLLGAEGEQFDYYINYNGTDGLGDLIEVFKEKFAEGGLHVQDWIRNLRKIATDPAAFVADILQSAQVLKSGVNNLKQLNDDAVGTPYFDARVASLADGLTPLLAQDRVVVLVPHSQGNQYALAVVDELRRREVDLTNLRIVGAANPARGPVGIPGAVYFTSVSDQVMNGLRLLFPVAPGNDGSVSMFQGDDPVLGHDFGSIYTNPKYTLAPRLKAAILLSAEGGFAQQE